MATKDEFMVIHTSNEMKYFLKNKARRHQNYSFYVDEEGLDKTKDNGLKLSTGYNWNDPIDKKNFNTSNEIINFGKSFIYSKSENIAMWLLYAKENGYLVKFNGQIFREMLNEKVKFVFSYNKKEYELNEVEFELIDILYASDSDKQMYLKKSDYSRTTNNFLNLNCIEDKLDYYIKNIGWYFENECRLIVSIPINKIRNLIDKNINKDELIKNSYIFMRLKNNDDILKKAEIFDSPLNKKIIYNPSFYQGKLKWESNKEVERN